MNDLANFFNYGWVGIVIGLGASFYFYKKSLRKPAPTLCFESLRLIGGKSSALPESVSVLFLGQEIPRLNKTIVRVWNDGNATLHGDSVAARDPLRISLSDDGKFLSAKLIRTTREVNESHVEIATGSADSVLISFSFLDPGDGMAFECLHTDSKLTPSAEGTFIGNKKGWVVKAAGPRAESESWFDKAVYSLLTYGPLVLGVGLIVLALLPKDSIEFLNQTTSIFRKAEPGGLLSRSHSFIVGLLFFIQGLAMWEKRRRHFPKHLE